MKTALALAALACIAHASTLRVLVVDAGKQPCAGVPLAIRSALVPPKLEPSFATTREDGVAEFKDVDRFFTDEARAQIPEVFFAFPLSSQEGEPLLMRDVPTGVLRITLPRTGTATAFLLGEEPIPKIASARVSWRDTIEGRPHSWTIDAIDTTGHRIVIPYLGLGVWANVSVSDADGRILGVGTLPEITKEGAAGSVDLEVSLGDSPWILRGRAIDEDGQPLVHRELRFRFGSGISEAWLDASEVAADSAIVHTGANGAFRVQLRGADLETLRRRDKNPARDPTGAFGLEQDSEQLVEIRVGYRRERDHMPVQAVVVHPVLSFLGADRASSALNLNDVRLSSSPIVAYGVVLPRTAWAFGGAFGSSVGLVERIEHLGASGLADAAGLAKPIEWRNLPGSDVECDAVGSFELRAPPGMGHTADSSVKTKHTFVFSRGDGWLPTLAEIQLPAAKPLVIRPVEPSLVTGTVLVDSDIDPRILEVELRYHEHQPLHEWLGEHGNNLRGAWPGVVTPDDRGVFHWGALPPGVVDVRFRIHGSNQVILESTHEVLALAADSGASSTKFDLRGRLK